MPWKPSSKKTERIPFSKKEIFNWAIKWAIVIAVLIFIVLSYSGYNIFGSRKTIVSTIVRKPTFEKEVKVKDTIILRAVTESSTRRPDGGHEAPRTCDEFLVLHFRSQTATKELAEKLRSVNGVERAEPVGLYKMIVERPCYERYKSLWTWEEVWKNIRPVILPYLPQKQALNLPTPRKQRGAVLFYKI